MARRLGRAGRDHLPRPRGDGIDGDLALCHGLVHTQTTRGGEEAAWWARMTTALARTDDGWRVIHDHVSVPFYMDGSFRAALDLEPEQA